MDKFFRVRLTLQHKKEGLTEDQASDFYAELTEVAEKYNLECIGEFKPVDEDGYHIAQAEDLTDILD